METESGNADKLLTSAEGAEIIDFGVARRNHEGKSFYMYGRAGDMEPPADNFQLEGMTLEGITIWRYVGYLSSE